TPTTIHTLSLHDALPIFKTDTQKCPKNVRKCPVWPIRLNVPAAQPSARPGLESRATATTCSIIGSTQLCARDVLSYHIRVGFPRSEEHTSELQSRGHLVC